MLSAVCVPGTSGVQRCRRHPSSQGPSTMRAPLNANNSRRPTRLYGKRRKSPEEQAKDVEDLRRLTDVGFGNGSDDATNYLEEQQNSERYQILKQFMDFNQKCIDAGNRNTKPGLTFSPKYVPKSMRPRTEKEYEQFKYAWEMNRSLNKRWTFEDYEMTAYELNAYQNDTCENKFAQIRYVSGIVQQFDDADYAMAEKAPHHISPWARAELVFAPIYPEFNEEVKKHQMEWVRKWPEFSDEELAILDELTGMTDQAEEEALIASNDQAVLDSFVDGVLPGMYLSEVGNMSIADDIFGQSLEEVDDVAADVADEVE